MPLCDKVVREGNFKMSYEGRPMVPIGEIAFSFPRPTFGGKGDEDDQVAPRQLANLTVDDVRMKWIAVPTGGPECGSVISEHADGKRRGLLRVRG